MATQNNPNIGFENFMLIINNLLDKHAPFKEQAKRKEKLRFKPWITKDILRSIKQRDKVYKEMIKVKNSQTKQLKLSLYIVDLLKKSKESYYRKYFEDNKRNCKAVWNGINQIIYSKSKANAWEPNCLLINGKAITQPKDIEEDFNVYFTSISKELQKHIPSTKRNFSDCLKNLIVESFFLTPTTSEEMSDLIQTLSLNKSTGPNSIPTSILKKIKNEISIPLSAIINNSFENGIFPNLLKSAQVIPVFKNGSRLSCNNYRPISLLSNIGKIIEKLIHKTLNLFLEQHKVFYALQFGFRLNTSTNNALMSITENMQTHLDKNELTAGVFIDQRKAFDTVDHDILLTKLDHYGIRGLSNDWFRSCLKGRQQFVSIGNQASTIKEMVSGVPHGSVLGPVLFLIYISDLHLCLKYSKAYHVADDTNVNSLRPFAGNISKENEL